MNIQLAQKRALSEDGTLIVHSVFNTIQGEGPFTGHRAFFIRLADCNLQCPACDTDYTSHRMKLTVDEILAAVRVIGTSGTLVVITGGEPFRQDITPLCKKLLEMGHYVQIETNGTLPPPSIAFLELCTLDSSKRDSVFVVCSPKTGKINSEIQVAIGAYKYVLRDGDCATDGLPRSALGLRSGSIVARPPGGFKGPVYIQPEDSQDKSKNMWNRRAAIDSAMKHGHILQLQIHKLIEVQ